MQPPPPNPSDKEGPFFPRINDEGFLAQICDRINKLVMTVKLSGTQGLGTWHTVPKHGVGYLHFSFIYPHLKS
jgi:hypothetical protein